MMFNKVNSKQKAIHAERNAPHPSGENEQTIKASMLFEAKA